MSRKFHKYTLQTNHLHRGKERARLPSDVADNLYFALKKYWMVYFVYFGSCLLYGFVMARNLFSSFNVNVNWISLSILETKLIMLLHHFFPECCVIHSHFKHVHVFFPQLFLI